VDPTRAHIITGSFGSGKTTAIRWLMAHKPEEELWVVILNEFTDAGIDALQVAQASRGNYEVRLVAGGCLCCVGELEFGKQLRDLLRNFKPAKILIEPSGAGHAADIIDTLALYESQNALQLDSVVCLVDPQDAGRILAKRPPIEWSQIQSADALLLSKPDLANATERQNFEQIAAEQYPQKPYLGTCREANQSWLRRMKGVFRTGLGPSWLVQSQGRGLTGEDSAFRRDSRIEIVLSAEPTPEFLDLWRGLLRDAANPPQGG
jgi:G3E family GTPase